MRLHQMTLLREWRDGELPWVHQTMAYLRQARLGGCVGEGGAKKPVEIGGYLKYLL